LLSVTESPASYRGGRTPLDPLWPWIILVGLGAFHGLIPAMGWLFAVALGLTGRVARLCSSRSCRSCSVLPGEHRTSHRLYRTGHLVVSLMSTAHGAGLMLIPALMPLQEHADHMHAMPLIDSMWIAALAVAVHTVAMLAVSGAIALIVYDFVGLGILRRGWINLDLVWAAALIAMGLFLLLTELPGVPGY
jgi:hypothetical protein